MTLALILAALLPAWEMRVVDRVADGYNLKPTEKALLIAVRRAENGTPPYYYGVADRRCNSYEKQCRWCANTIRLRYDGDVERFAKRYCPTNWRVWLKNVRFFLRRQSAENSRALLTPFPNI